MTASSIRKNLIFPANFNAQKVLYAAIFLSATIFILGLALFVSSLHLSTKKITTTSVANASAGGVLLGGATNFSGAMASSTGKSSMFELNIANNGLVFLRNAKVISISGDQKIHVTIGWGNTSFSWSVGTDALTKFLDSKGVKADFSQIKVGGTVIVTGDLVGNDGAEPLINAEFIRIL